MEAATAADFTQSSENADQYVTLGSRVMFRKGYVSDLTIGGLSLDTYAVCVSVCTAEVAEKNMLTTEKSMLLLDELYRAFLLR